MSNNNKTFATTVLASVAIVMTITALTLVSPQSSWDGALLTDSGLDSFVVTTTAIPNSPDAWSAFDAVSDAMSSDWLIPLAFAVVNIVSINGVEADVALNYNLTTTTGSLTTLSVIATGNGTTFTYEWTWIDDVHEPDDIQGLGTSTITFTAPSVDENTDSYLTVVVNDGDHPATANIVLTVLNSSTTTTTTTPPIIDVGSNSPPQVNAGPDLTITKGDSSVTLTGATATDAQDAITALDILWTQNPLDTVTIGSETTLEPTITVPASATERTVTLTLTVIDTDDNVVNGTRVLTINTPPQVDAGADLDVTKGSSVQLLGATADDANAGDTLGYAWTSGTLGAVTFNRANSLNPIVTAVSGTAFSSVTLTLTVNDGFTDVVDTMILTLSDTAVNNPPTAEAGPDREVPEGESITLSGATATDADRDTLTYAWTQSPLDTVTITNVGSLKPRITASSVNANTTVTLTLTVNDGFNLPVPDMMELTIINFVNTPPTADAGPPREVFENQSITLSGSGTDINAHDTLSYTWSAASSDIVLDVADKERLTFTAPGVGSTGTDYVFTLEVTDGEDSDTDTVTVKVRNVPISVLNALYNPGNGQLTITFNQDIATADYTNIHINGTGSDGIPLSNVTDTSYLGRTITAILSSEQKETYADLTGPYLDIASGAVTDTDGDTIDETPDFDIRVLQKKKSSSSSAPIVDLNTLVQARIVDIPSAISEQVSSHNAADLLEPILHDDTFDFPLTINDYYYLLDDTTNTLTPQTVTAGQSTEIEFTVYTSEDLAHFTLYLNLQDDDTRYADSDTYITYTNDGTVAVTDPHGYIADATITVTEEDNSMPEKKTVRITIEFGEEPMGPTNMVAYMWNTDRRAAIVNLIDAIDVTAAAQTRQNSASTDGSSGSAKVNSEPDVSDDDRSDGQNSQSVTKSGIVVIGSNADDAQTLSLIRMWSGFASESITDAELLESMGLDNYPVVHIPDWVMTELGALVSNNDVTVEEFRTALVYMLEMLTA